jgi:hypothetical protein
MQDPAAKQDGESVYSPVDRVIELRGAFGKLLIEMHSFPSVM